MCGITGIIHPGAGDPGLAAPGAEAIRRMNEAIRHRGPDGEGFYFGPGVALGHRRLAVVDLAGGHQPMADLARRVWITFNGEIYNHLDLRVRLEALGHVFTSRCDTEVLIHGWKAWGEKLFPLLNGMFAFGIWDETHRTLILARDRMGQKPLYYAQLSDGTFFFASEAKGLVAHPEFRAEIDEAGLAAYLTYEYLPGELSLFRGVRKLLPGHFLRLRGGTTLARQWWSLPATEAPVEGNAVERFRDLFDLSVRRRLMADVPLGVFLSGGIDSSAVASSMAALRPPSTIDTFSIGFDDPSFDESPVARRVAAYLGTRHHEKLFRVDTMRDVLPQVVARFDDPFGDPSLLPTFLLSQFAREHVTVALGGDGGDELLLGYPTFRADSVARLFRRLPAPAKKLARQVAEALPVDMKNFSPDFIVNRFLRGADYPDDVRHIVWLGSVVPGSNDDPLAPDIRRAFPFNVVMAPAREAFAAARHPSIVQRLGYQYCRTYLADDILYKVDRASMMVSLEVRSPFLDVELVEMVARLPLRWKIRRGRSKEILRRAFAERLPREVLSRSKKGFGIPIGSWLKGPLRDMVTDLLSPARIQRSGLLRYDIVERLLDDHLQGRRNNRKILWTLVALELWRDHYGVARGGVAVL